MIKKIKNYNKIKKLERVFDECEYDKLFIKMVTEKSRTPKETEELLNGPLFHKKMIEKSQQIQKCFNKINSSHMG